MTRTGTARPAPERVGRAASPPDTPVRGQRREDGAGHQPPAGQPVRVRLASELRRLAGNQPTVEVTPVPADRSAGVTVRDVLAALQSPYPGVHHGALDERGVVRQHVNVFVGIENTRFTGGLATPVPQGADVSILPAVSGG